MEGSSLSNLRMFKKLCGPDALKHTVLTTTHWGSVSNEVGEDRERQLRDNDRFWGSMLARGAEVDRFSGTREDGVRLISSLLKKQKVTLQIQKELVVENKQLIDTEAGHAVSEDLAKMQEKHREEIKALREELQESLENKDKETQIIIQKDRVKLEREIRRVQKAQESLRTGRREGMREVENEWNRKTRELVQQRKEEQSAHEKATARLLQEMADLKSTISRLGNA